MSDSQQVIELRLNAVFSYTALCPQCSPFPSTCTLAICQAQRVQEIGVPCQAQRVQVSLIHLPVCQEEERQVWLALTCQVSHCTQQICTESLQQFTHRAKPPYQMSSSLLNSVSLVLHKIYSRSTCKVGQAARPLPLYASSENKSLCGVGLCKNPQIYISSPPEFLPRVPFPCRGFHVDVTHT